MLGIAGAIVLFLVLLLLGGAGGLIVALGIPALVVTVALLWWALHGRIRSNGAARVVNSW